LNSLKEIIREIEPIIWGNISPKPTIIPCADADDLVRAAAMRGQTGILLRNAKLINAYWSIRGTQANPVVDVFFNWDTIKRPQNLLTYDKIEGIVIHELSEARVGLEDFLSVKQPTDLSAVASLAALPSNQMELEAKCRGTRLEYLANMTALKEDVRPEPLLAMYASSFKTGITQNLQGRRDNVSFLMRNAPYTWFEYECLNIPQQLHQVAGTVAIVHSGKLYELSGFSQITYAHEMTEEYIKSIPEAERAALDHLYRESLSNRKLLEDVEAVANLVGTTLSSVWSNNVTRKRLSQKERLRKIQGEQRKPEIVTILKMM